jgi:hypothetical protein
MAAGLISVEHDWITHDGGATPAAAAGLLVDLRFRNGFVNVEVYVSDNVWKNGTPPAKCDGRGDDVVAWRPSVGQALPNDFYAKLCDEHLPGIAVDPTLPAAAPSGPFAAPEFEMAVGDINGTAKGTGARANGGKTPYELVPLALLADSLERRYGLTNEIAALRALGVFQARGGDGREALFEALQYLGLDGWDECANVFDYGRGKYAAWNWARGMAWTVPLACAARHILAMIRGETNDSESGKPHRGHAYCNVVMLLTYETTYTDGDDRPAKGLL